MATNIWITGASRGIGRAIALGVAQMYKKEEAPVNLIINSRHNDNDLNELAEELKKQQTGVLKLVGDVSDEKDREEMLRRIHEELGGLDVLINNAGISVISLLQDMSVSEIETLIGVNLSAPIALSALVLPDLLRSTHNPRIINISSVWGNVGASCETVYSATKGGLNSFTRALAKELAPSHIPVNAVSCGYINTAMNSQLSKEDKAALFEEIPAGRGGEPEEAAQLVCMLLRANDYLTGQIITLDGGWT